MDNDFFSSRSRTDLAVELNDTVDKEDTAYKGVKVREFTDGPTGIKISQLTITDKDGERLFNKKQGTYITIEASECCLGDEEYDNSLVNIITEQLFKLIEPLMVNNKNILVIGLGNRDITADSLGPDVVEGLLINRHIVNVTSDNYRLSSLVPGVMAQTGMETSQIIKGIVNTTKPGVVIAIDALAARSVSHLNKTFQISDKGIHPGSGVGNHRAGITSESVGVPVIALGVPTVIEMNNMFVTPKDVDIVVRANAEILSDSINSLVYSYET